MANPHPGGAGNAHLGRGQVYSGRGQVYSWLIQKFQI